jgi:hypothetical protein
MSKFMTERLPTPALQAPRALHEWELEDELPPLLPPTLTPYEEGRAWGYWEGVAATQPFLDQLNSDLDRMHRAVDRGTFKTPMRSMGKSHFELEAIRNGGR